MTVHPGRRRLRFAWVAPCLAAWSLLYVPALAASPSPPSACAHVDSQAEARSLPLTRVAACLQDRLHALHDVSLHLEGNLRSGPDSAPMALSVDAAALLPDMLRYEIISPESLAGMIQVINRSADSISTFYPVTNTVVVGPLEALEQQQRIPFDVSQVLTLPPRR